MSLLSFAFAYGCLQVVAAQRHVFWNMEYTVFSEARETWNAAAQYCHEMGSEMLKMDTLETMYALSVLAQNPGLQSKNLQIWTGLHYRGTATGKKKIFAWHDCSPTSSLTFKKEKEECGSVWINDFALGSVTWHVEKCKKQSAFACQRFTNTCQRFTNFAGFTNMTETPVVVSKTMAGKLTVSDCETECLGDDEDNLNCMGFSLDNDTCTLHFAPSPAHVWSSIQSRPLYVKFCFSLVVNSTFMKTELYINDKSPVIGCTQAIHTMLAPTTTIHGINSTLVTTGIIAASSLVLTMEDVATLDVSTIMASTGPLLKSMHPLTDVTWTSDLQPTPISSNFGDRSKETITETVAINSIKETDKRSVQGNIPATRTLSESSILSSFCPDCSMPSTSTSTPRFVVFSTDGATVAQSSSRGYLTGSAHERVTSEVEGSITISTHWTSSVGFEGQTECPCQCDNHRQPSNMTSAEKKIFITKIVEKLAVEKANLSSNQRKYISADDPRVSSQGIGYIGIIFMIVVFGGIVVLDFPILISEIKKRLCGFSAPNSHHA